jgi:putative membrane protein
MTLAHALSGPAGTWDVDPLVLAMGVLAVVLYARGSKLLSTRGSPRRPGSLKQLSFYAGVFVAIAAVVSPLHGWSERLFAAHMTQHLLLVIVAAPLIVVGRPGGPFLAALPRSMSRPLGRTLAALRNNVKPLLHPLSIWVLHTLVLWAWHQPTLYDAALDNEFLHALEHSTFFGTALLLWAAVFGERPVSEGASVILLFTTGLQSAALGALIVFASSPLYESHVQAAGTVATDPLTDQQLAGALMWVPPGILYLAVTAVMFGRLLQSPRLEEVGS